MTTNQAQDMLDAVAAGKGRAARDTTSNDVQYQRKVALGRSGKPFAEDTQDAVAAAASGRRREN